MFCGKAIIVVLLFTLVGCSEPIDKTSLAGKYVLNKSRGVDVIQLRSDSIYVHTYKSDVASATSATGRWELEEIEGAKTVTLHDFRALPNENTRGSGFYLLQIQRKFGRVRLVVDSDLGIFYEQQRIDKAGTN